MKRPTSRRRFLAGATVAPLVPPPVGAAEPHPDAELMALGRRFDAAFAAYLPVRSAELAAGEARQAAWEARPDLTLEAIATNEDGARENWAALCARFEPPIQEAQILIEAADHEAEAAFRLPPPCTMAGLAVLVRMLAGFHVELWDDPAAELDIDERMLQATLEAALALAGVDRLGRPVANEAALGDAAQGRAAR